MTGATIAPSRSLTQRMDALELANQIRCGRAKARQELRSFAKTFGEVLELDVCQSAKVWDLVVCIPKVGKVKTNQVFSRIGISSSKRVDGLSSRQRGELLAWVAEREQGASFVAEKAAAERRAA